MSVNLLPISHPCPRVAAMSVRRFSGAKIVVFGGPGVGKTGKYIPIYILRILRSYIIVTQSAVLQLTRK